LPVVVVAELDRYCCPARVRDVDWRAKEFGTPMTIALTVTEALSLLAIAD
jgi:hypothetical protein